MSQKLILNLQEDILLYQLNQKLQYKSQLDKGIRESETQLVKLESKFMMSNLLALL